MVIQMLQSIEQMRLLECWPEGGNCVYHRTVNKLIIKSSLPSNKQTLAVGHRVLPVKLYKRSRFFLAGHGTLNNEVLRSWFRN